MKKKKKTPSPEDINTIIKKCFHGKLHEEFENGKSYDWAIGFKKVFPEATITEIVLKDNLDCPSYLSHTICSLTHKDNKNRETIETYDHRGNKAKERYLLGEPYSLFRDRKIIKLNPNTKNYIVEHSDSSRQNKKDLSIKNIKNILNPNLEDVVASELEAQKKTNQSRS